jgi:threonine synthase
MWKAFAELEALGWISDKKPKIFVVQSSGCAPLVKAFEEQKGESTFWQKASTIASGLCVPKAFADRLILSALRESNGGAVAVTDDEIMSSVREAAKKEGILVCPEGGATLAALKHLRDKKLISEEGTVVVFNTGSALKYMHLFGL